MELLSNDFRHGDTIPATHTGEGEDTSPHLKWTGAPEETKEFALIVDDPDAPTNDPWVHWVIYKIPGDTNELPQGIETAPELRQPQGARQGENSWGQSGYRGPFPPKPHGQHHYHFQLYALDTDLPLEPGLTKQELKGKMKGHVLAEAELIGLYER